MEHITDNIKQRKTLLRDREAGVTLLLAILIMSGLILVSTTAGFLLIEQVRSSRAVLYTEVALGAAQAGAEEAIWAVKRQVSISTCPSTNSPAGMTSGYSTFCKSYGLASIDLPANQPVTFYLYDPNNINGDIDLKSMTPSWYNYMTVRNISGPYAITVNLTRLDGTPIGSQPVIVSPGTTQTINNLSGPSGADNRMKVVVQSPSIATVEVNTDQGMPNFPTVDAVGCAGRVNPTSSCTGNEIFSRRFNVTIPQ